MVWAEIRNTGIRLYNASLKATGAERKDLQDRAEVVLKVSINSAENVANESWYYLGRIAEDKYNDRINASKENNQNGNKDDKGENGERIESLEGALHFLEDAVHFYKNAVFTAVSNPGMDYKDVVARIVNICLLLGNRTVTRGAFTRTYYETAYLELIEGGYGVDLTKPTAAWKLLLLARIEKAMGKCQEAIDDLESALKDVNKRGDGKMENIEDYVLRGDIHTERADTYQKMGRNFESLSANLSAKINYAKANARKREAMPKEDINALMN